MDPKDRIINFVRWHNEVLHAPAPHNAIVAMILQKGNERPTIETIGTFETMADVSILDVVDRGELRFVKHDYLPNGYTVVEDPS
jgi:hypothetical protein